MRINTRFVSSFVLTLLLNSCAQTPQTEHRHADQIFSETTPEPSNNTVKLSPPVVSSPNERLASSASHHNSTRKFFNVSVHEINARDFFMGLVMDSKENIVVHPEVKGTISLMLKNVTLEEVLDVVEKVYGYDCRKTRMGYIIYPPTLQTKIFKIDRLDLKREGSSTTKVTANQNHQNNQQANNQTPQQRNNLPGNNLQSNSSTITTSNEDIFWVELKDALHSIIGIDPQTTVTLNKQSGIIVVRAKPMQLHEVESFINATQNQISRQVILEAKIMEVVLDEGHQDGVDWRVLAQKGLNAAGIVTGFGFAPSALLDTSSPIKPNPAYQGRFPSIFTLGSNTTGISDIVKLLETQGKTNVLSTPRISTLNNQKAIIKVGRDELFISGITAGSPGGALGGNASLPTPNFSTFFSGIVLDVTPQIDNTESITLHIHPSITRVETVDKSFTLSNEDSSFPTAVNIVRESDSIVKAQNGQVIVLGGLMQENQVENKEGISRLASIPVLGHLFRMDTGTTQKSELIILLKASIIENGSDWQNELDATQPRMEQLESKPLWK